MAGANLTLDSAKRIAAAVKRLEAMPTSLAGGPQPRALRGVQFLGHDNRGRFYGWQALRLGSGDAFPKLVYQHGWHDVGNEHVDGPCFIGSLRERAEAGPCRNVHDGHHIIRSGLVVSVAVSEEFRLWA